VSDLIEVAGGRSLRRPARSALGARARGRASDVVARDPDIILASWCGKPVGRRGDRRASGLRERGRDQAGQVHELAGEDVL